MTNHGERWTKGGWRSPTGIGTMAGVAGVLVALIALFVDRTGEADPAVTRTTPSGHTDVFVYGTTMPDHLRYPAIEEYVASVSRDSASGRIFDTGAGYPAAKFGGVGTIHGYVLRLRPDRASEALRTFTQLEAGLFQQVTLATTGGITATAYEFIGSTEGMTAVTGEWSGAEA